MKRLRRIDLYLPRVTTFSEPPSASHPIQRRQQSLRYSAEVVDGGCVVYRLGERTQGVRSCVPSR
jgi:hypothetical protein